MPKKPAEGDRARRIREYIACPSHCPYCYGTKNIDWGDPQLRMCKCGVCGGEWQDIRELVGVSLTKQGRKVDKILL